ncbi:DNA-binding MarR family transcriptional regulator [Crossiella equi]|uniref:DNA-binding MarR family transcriptional regulator n=1 Tax=Crossiella equi TaxID=130796 RepID=A0ABS5AD20_9PSEU|nr:MarR family transcriptional regulator [Crossiella equi]MBP2474483.1 DNA-binding MarR family transcriptional regulator [Crossiella equi]
MAEESTWLDQVGPAFSRLRRPALRDHVEDPLSRRDNTRIFVLTLVEDAGDGRLTVGGVADRLDVDPSVASRMVSEAIKAGTLERVAAQEDGRRVCLRLTELGREHLARFRRHQRVVFERITRDWSGQDREVFAKLLVRYVEDLWRL